MTGKVRIGICEWALPIQGPTGLALAAELGFEGVEVELRDSDRGFPLSKDFVQERYLDCARKKGIEIPSVALNELDLCCMTGPAHAEETERALQTIAKGIETARALKVSLVQVPCFNRNDLRKQDPAQACEVFQEMCDAVRGEGMLVGAENILPPKEMMDMIRRVNRSNFKLYFDTQNYFLNGGFAGTDLLEELFPFVCEVHVKDGNAGSLSGALLGEGEAGFSETIRMLVEKGYSGWMLLENYYDRKPLRDREEGCLDLMRKDLETMKKALSL
jgi:sugar phosphate isomerase/epimerase